MRSNPTHPQFVNRFVWGVIFIAVWFANPVHAQNASLSSVLQGGDFGSSDEVYESVYVEDSTECCLPCQGDSWRDRLTLFAGVDGSKQPQDLGVNANLGGQFNLNWALPLNRESGLALQLGSGIVTTGNAVRVYELLGESTSRVQSFTTVEAPRNRGTRSHQASRTRRWTRGAWGVREIRSITTSLDINVNDAKKKKI